MADPISNAQKAAKLRIRKDAFNRDLDVLADNLMSGKITLGLYEEDFRTRLREYMAGSAMIGKGDPTKMTPSNWGKVGVEMKRQYKWLHGFSKDIFDNRDTVTVEAIKARSHLYAEAGVKIANRMQAGAFDGLLPWIPGDGSTVCLNRCKCEWLMSVLSEGAETKIVQAIWALRPAEHCEDCVPREGHTEIYEVPVDTEIPLFIGLGV